MRPEINRQSLPTFSQKVGRRSYLTPNKIGRRLQIIRLQSMVMLCHQAASAQSMLEKAVSHMDEKPEGMSTVIVDSIVHVECFGRTPSRAGRYGMYGCFSSDLASWHSTLMERNVLPMLSSMPGFGIGMIIALGHVSGICPVEIDRLKMLV